MRFIKYSSLTVKPKHLGVYLGLKSLACITIIENSYELSYTDNVYLNFILECEISNTCYVLRYQREVMFNQVLSLKYVKSKTVGWSMVMWGISLSMYRSNRVEIYRLRLHSSRPPDLCPHPQLSDQLSYP